MFNPRRWDLPPGPRDPQSGEYFWEHRMYGIYPANLVSIAPRVSEIWITQYFPIDLNVKKFNPPAPGFPWADHPQTTSFPSMMFALPWAKISCRLQHPALRYPQPYKQTNKNSKLNITPNATLYGEIKISPCLLKLQLAKVGVFLETQCNFANTRVISSVEFHFEFYSY